MRSSLLNFGTSIFSGICRPHSLIGFILLSQRRPAYSVHTPSCMVETVMVRPPYLPPTAASASVLVVDTDAEQSEVVLLGANRHARSDPGHRDRPELALVHHPQVSARLPDG